MPSAEAAGPRGDVRALTSREEAVLVAMIGSATPFDGEIAVGDGDRARWLAQVPATRAGERCGCGTCPSIALTDATGSTVGRGRSGVVLEAGSPGALLLLFVADGRPSYLELAPLSEKAVFHQFPAVADITFG